VFDARELASVLLADPDIQGLTFSGGEPMAQAAPLADLAAHARSLRNIDIVCFTGYPYSQLVSNPPYPGVPDLLSQIDVLIDGPYVAAKNDGSGLRGSTNQRVHFLSHRLRHFNFLEIPRTLEISILEHHITFIGIPPKYMLQTIEQDLAAFLPVG